MSEVKKWSVLAIDADNDEVERKVFAPTEDDAKDRFLFEYGHFVSEPVKSWKVVELGPGDVPISEIKTPVEEEEDEFAPTYTPPPRVESEEEKEEREMREKAAKLKPFTIVAPVRKETVETHSDSSGDWNAWA